MKITRCKEYTVKKANKLRKIIWIIKNLHSEKIKP